MRASEMYIPVYQSHAHSSVDHILIAKSPQLPNATQETLPSPNDTLLCNVPMLRTPSVALQQKSRFHIRFLHSGLSFRLRRRPLSLPFQPRLISLHATDQCAPPPNSGPVLIKHDRNRNDSHLDQTQQRAGPMRSQLRIHGRPSKRQRPADERPHDRVSRHGASGVDAVAVGQVIVRVDEDGGVAGAEGDASENRPDPVPGDGHARPSEPELADGREHGGDADDADHGFGRHLAGFRVDSVRVDHAPDEGFGGDDGEGADADADEGQT